MPRKKSDVVDEKAIEETESVNTAETEVIEETESNDTVDTGVYVNEVDASEFIKGENLTVKDEGVFLHSDTIKSVSLIPEILTAAFNSESNMYKEMGYNKWCQELRRFGFKI